MIRGRIHVRVVFNDFPEIAAELERTVNLIVAKAAHDIEALTKRNIQGHGLIDTGAMLNSVIARPLNARQWVVTVGAHYGIYHEFGTRFLPARPFLGPAADEVKPAFLTALRRLAA